MGETITEESQRQGGGEAAAEHEAPEGVDPVTGEVLEQPAAEEGEGAAPGTDEGGERAEPQPEQPAELDETAQSEAQFATERELERAAKSLDRAVSSYRGKVEEFIQTTGQSLIANRMDLDFCPGYIFHPDVRPLDGDQEAFARLLLGMPIEPQFAQDPASAECPTCEGWGRVKTGSKVASRNVITCERCAGHGFLRSGGAPAAADLLIVPLGDEPPAPLSEQEREAEDVWGTPRSHPDWGKSPQYRNANWAAELEAYKAGQPAPVV